MSEPENLPDMDLPGMWSHSDFEGGRDDEAEKAYRDRIDQLFAEAVETQGQSVPAPLGSSVRRAVDEALKKFREAERTVIVPAHLEEQTRTLVEKSGLAGITVTTNPYLPDDQIWIMPTHVDWSDSGRMQFYKPPLFPDLDVMKPGDFIKGWDGGA